MTVHAAKPPSLSLQSLRHSLDHILPIDVLTTHYPTQVAKFSSTLLFCGPPAQPFVRLRQLGGKAR